MYNLTDINVASQSVSSVPAIATNKAKLLNQNLRLLVNQLLKIGYLTVKIRMTLSLSINRGNLVLLRQNSSRAAVSVNTTRPINTTSIKATVNYAKPASNVFTKAHSYDRRSFNKFTTSKNCNFTQKVNTAKGNVTTLRPKAVGNPHQELQEKGVIDSGCSRYMTGNMSYLFEYEEIDGGYVTFRGGAKGGKITSKGSVLLVVSISTANYVKYALTVNPTVYTSCIEQFWATAKVKNVNWEAHIQALVDKKKVIITKASIRRDLRFEDEGGVDCLSNEAIFEQLTLMGTMASVIIYLATNQKFNFSKYIYDNMVKHLDGGVKFLLYPRFVQIFLDNQIEGMDLHNAILVISSHTKKVFANMKRKRKNFSRKVTPLFETMMVQPPEDMGEGSKIPIDPHHTPIVINLEEAKTVQVKEIASLKKRVKKLEQKRKSRTLGLKRLRKGRMIDNIDQDIEITLVDDTQGRMNEEDMFGVNDLDGDEVVVDVSAITTAGIEVTTATTTPQISKDELIKAYTSIEIKAAKPKAITTVATTVTAAGTWPKEKGIVMQEPSETPSPKPIDSS
nr:ribonuclease H-like domain-containing protein [Tanacetum cinerariifolium]